MVDLYENGLRHSVEVLDTLTDLISELRDIDIGNKEGREKFKEKMEYIHEYCYSCKAMVSIYTDLFNIKVDPMRDEF